MAVVPTIPILITSSLTGPMYIDLTHKATEAIIDTEFGLSVRHQFTGYATTR